MEIDRNYMKNLLKTAGVLAIAAVIVMIWFLALKNFKAREISESADAGKAGYASAVSAYTQENSQHYTHSKPRFTLDYPSELAVETIKEREGETILFQGTGEPVKAERLGFQIFISSLGEGAALTEELIQENLSGIITREPVEVVLGGGVQTFVFKSQDASIGETVEVWFVRGGYLYEVTAYGHLEVWLAGILSSLRFAD